MSSNKDNDNLTHLENDDIYALDHCSVALHALIRQAEQALKVPKDSQGEVKPVETKK